MKKILSLALAVLLVLGLFAGCGEEENTGTPGGAAQATEETESTPRELVILYTNDVHNAYAMVGADQEKPDAVCPMGYAALAAYADQLRDAGKNVLLIDGGDHLQGDAVGTLSRGAYLVDMMNRVGYDLAIPGNHEFDFGMDMFLNLAEQEAEYGYVCCNFLDLTTGDTVFPPYATFEVEDFTIAFVGIATPETLTKSNPDSFRDETGAYIYGFAGENEGQALYDRVQAAINQAKGEGADYVIALGHLGIDPESSPWTSYEVIAHTSGLTAFLDAHSHSVIEGEYITDADNKDVPLLSAGTKLKTIGQLVLDLDEGTVEASLVSGLRAEDAKVLEYTRDVTAQYEDLLEEVVAVSRVDLVTHDPENSAQRWIRQQETNLGDLVADACRAALDADIAIINGGGIRSPIEAGDVTYGQILAAQPYGNGLCLVEATGQNILDALELSCSQMGTGELGGFLQVSGITFTVDTTIASGVELDDKGMFVNVNGQRRVKDVLVGGEPIDPRKIYTLASYDFLILSGGDGYTMFADCPVLQEYAMLDNQALIAYIQDDLGGVITEAQYGDPKGQGRIVTETTPAEQN